ncbi:uncharacterized protein [Drosophila takahashii]|uniref:uncharacterized protein n=1 Tax=Drosophila takahashii TaxID=29030 RepID=UPI001CF8FDD7|nr:uncharacterized protein LOC108057223 [Drosophila takahashii]
MSLRVALICLAILAMAYAQPAPGAPEVIEDSVSVEQASEEPIDSAYQRTLVLLLPLLFPNTFYVPSGSG